MPVPLAYLTRFGIHLPDADLYLDARDAPGTVFVSHAHADHCSNAPAIVCTPETATLHEMRRGCREAQKIWLGVETSFEKATITLLPAGHALGSAMIVSESDHGRVAYTGDYKLRHNPFSPGAEVPACDTLIMECTFGEPRYVFPPEELVFEQLFTFIDETLDDGGIPVIFAYALGKAQEVLYHLTARGYHVMLQSTIDALCRIHVDLGYPFPGPGTWKPYDHNDVGGHVVLTTPSTRKTPMIQRLPKNRTCYLSGWALHPGAANIYKGCDLVLPLSDHADWSELVRTAVESGAQKIYTVHGNKKFAAYLRATGLDAEHLADHPSFYSIAEDDPAPSEQRAQQLGLGL